MNKSLILNELLENWNLKHTHIKILDVLIGKELTAQQITKALNSKKQIIYPALNQLTEFSLIKRNEIGPQQMFSCIDFYKHIDGFINYKNKEFVNNQTRLLDLKKNDAIPHIAKVTSHKNYSDNMISMFNEETFIRIVTRIYSVPYELYGSNIKNFIKHRNIIRKNRDVLSDDPSNDYSTRMAQVLFEKHKKKITYEYIVTSVGVNSHFDMLKRNLTEKEFNEFYKDIYTFIHKTPSLNIHVTENIIPTEFIMSKNHLLLITKSKEYEKNTSKPIGLFIQSQDMINGYNQQFDEFRRESINVLSYLDRLSLRYNIRI
ncbi:MAG: hypothetical protein ACOCUI_02415 [bacterium]